MKNKEFELFNIEEECVKGYSVGSNQRIFRRFSDCVLDRRGFYLQKSICLALNKNAPILPFYS